MHECEDCEFFYTCDNMGYYNECPKINKEKVMNMNNLEKSKEIEKFLLENGFSINGHNGNIYPSDCDQNEFLRLLINNSIFNLDPSFDCGFEGNEGYDWKTSENHEDCFWISGHEGNFTIEIPLKDIKYMGILEEIYVANCDINDFKEVSRISF